MTDDRDRSNRFGSTIAAHQLSQCLNCAHWEGDRECAAFDGQQVPFEILENEFDHRSAHSQDNGTTWTPKNEDSEHVMDRWRSSGPK